VDRAAPWAFTLLRASQPALVFRAAGACSQWQRAADESASAVRQGERVIDWWLLPYGIALYPSAIPMVFSGQSRFHYPVMPFVSHGCGLGASQWG